MRLSVLHHIYWTPKTGQRNKVDVSLKYSQRLEVKTMEDIIIKLKDGKILIQLSEVIYEKDAIMAVAHKMIDSCFILVKPAENNQINIYFEPQSYQTEKELETIAKKFCNEVLDMQIRLDIERRYGNIRDLIIQQAFSPIENIKG